MAEEKENFEEEANEDRSARLEANRRQAAQRQAVKNIAKQAIKKKVKKKVKQATIKVIINILGATAPIWGIILICLLAFLMLTYYVCEGGGFIAWVLRRTALGNLCSM